MKVKAKSREQRFLDLDDSDLKSVRQKENFQVESQLNFWFVQAQS